MLIRLVPQLGLLNGRASDKVETKQGGRQKQRRGVRMNRDWKDEKERQ